MVNTHAISDDILNCTLDRIFAYPPRYINTNTNTHIHTYTDEEGVVTMDKNTYLYCKLQIKCMEFLLKNIGLYSWLWNWKYMTFIKNLYLESNPGQITFFETWNKHILLVF